MKSAQKAVWACATVVGVWLGWQSMRLHEIKNAEPWRAPDCETNVTAAPFNVTLVTALYDIKRGDRDFSNYIEWVQRTLRIPRPFVIFCHPAHESVVRSARAGYMRMTTIITAEKFPLEGLAPIVEPIARRVGGWRYSPEWINSKYIPLMFSKFSWLEHAMTLDAYRTTHFYWFDAGISRFFQEGQPERKEPQVLDLLPASGVAIQVSSSFPARSMQQLAAGDVVIGAQANYFMGGVFGGPRASVRRVSYAMLAVLTQDMLARGVVDNEQNAFALLYTRHRGWFRPLFREDFPAPNCNFICV